MKKVFRVLGNTSCDIIARARSKKRANFGLLFYKLEVEKMYICGERTITMAQHVFGLPYQGSKGKFADEIVALFPKAENFIDIFFGGGAVTHAAMLSGKFKNFIANDLRKTPQAWNRCAEGDLGDLFRFVGREEFKETDDMLVKMVWSFGASCKTYACTGLNETIFRLVMGATVDERYAAWRRLLKEIQGREGNLYNDLHSVHPACTLRRLSAIKGLPKVACHNLDYREVAIPENSVVYCDPPYEGCSGYDSPFDHDAFWEWVRTVNVPVFVSSYTAPEDFMSVHRREIDGRFNRFSGTRHENVFIYNIFSEVKKP